jgi:hypothetical protein
MNKAKGILQLLADGQEVEGLNGASLSKELRDAFAQGAKALEFKQRVVSALNQTAASASPPPAREAAPAQAPASAARGNSMPRRWTPEEDAALRNEFEVQRLQVDAIAGLHQRSPYAIAIRLQNKFNLLTADEVETIRQRQASNNQVASAAPVSAAPAPVEEPAAPVATHAPAQAPAPVAASAPALAPSPAPIPASATDDNGLSTGQPAPDQDIPWGDESSADSFEMGSDGSVEPPSPAPVPAPAAAATAEDAPAKAAAEGPDYATLLEMELSMASEEVRTYANNLLSRLQAQPHIAPSIATLLKGEKMKNMLPNTLRMALLQKVGS